MVGIEELVALYSFAVTGIGVLLLISLAALSLRIKHHSAFTKRILFSLIVAVTILPTLFLAGSTIYLNTVSSSKGPVHWHADIEIWACGREIDLRDPTGWSNKIGTAILHEHNDKRIHLEGVVMTDRDATLGKFFRVIGGKLEKDNLAVPVNNRTLQIKPDMCADTQFRSLQVFAFNTDSDGYYFQKKLADPSLYTISAYSNVPPGDCIIIELDTPKDRTERLCRSYQVAVKTGKLKGERP